MNPLMKSSLTQPVCYEFCFPEQDTLVRVEVTEDGVTVRATRDSFNEQRKASFVRELVAEGFIDDTYRWFSSVGPESYLGVQWLVDYSWLVLSPRATATAQRFMHRVLAGVTLVWMGLVATLFLR